MSVIRDLLPIGLVVALVSGLTWLLLDHGMGLGRWMLAGLLLFHGWVHVLFALPTPEPSASSASGSGWPFDLGQSWLIANAGLDPTIVRHAGLIMVAAAAIAFVLAALSTVGVVVPTEAWPGLLAASAGISIVMLCVFFAPALLLGFAIDLAILWLVLLSGWSPMLAAHEAIA